MLWKIICSIVSELCVKALHIVKKASDFETVNVHT